MNTSVAGAASLASTRAGLLVGMPGRYGARAALLASPAALAPEWCVTLGATDEANLSAPVLVAARGAPWAAFVECGHAYLAQLPAGTLRLVERDVGALAAAAVDAGVAVLTAGRDLVMHAAGARVVLEERASPPSCVALAEVVGSLVAVACPRDEPSVVVGAVRSDGTTVRGLRHALPSPCVAVHAQGAANRVGLALTLADGGVAFALLNAEGKMVERPHVVLPAQGLDFGAARVLWVDRRFWMTAMVGEEWTLMPAEGGARRSLWAPGYATVVFHRARLVFAGARRRGSEDGVGILVTDLAGERREEHWHALTPGDQRARALRSNARRVLAEVAARGGDAGRGGAPLRLLEGGLGVEGVAADGAPFSLACAAEGPALRIWIRRGLAEPDEPSTVSFWRLVDWVRQGIGLRALSSDPLASGIARALGASEVESFRGTSASCTFEVVCPSVSLEGVMDAIARLKRGEPGAA